MVGFSGILRLFLESIQNQSTGKCGRGDVFLFSLFFEGPVVLYWQAEENWISFLHSLNLALKSKKKK